MKDSDRKTHWNGNSRLKLTQGEGKGFELFTNYGNGFGVLFETLDMEQISNGKFHIEL